MLVNKGRLLPLRCITMDQIKLAKQKQKQKCGVVNIISQMIGWVHNQREDL